MSEPWTFCPECGAPRGADHKLSCARRHPPPVPPAPDGWSSWPADMPRRTGDTGMDGKINARNAAGGVMPTDPPEPDDV